MTARFQLRPFRTPEDYAAAVPLLNLINAEPYTPETWAEEDKTQTAAFHCFRLVAETSEGQVVGFGESFRFPWAKPGKFYMMVIVAPAYRGQGLGARLLEAVEADARAAGGTILQASIRDNDPESRAWVERRGYRYNRHTFESALDLATFDPAPFAAVIPAVEASGIRFFTYADQPTDQLARQIHALMNQTFRDIPGTDVGDEPFDAWENRYLKHKDARPEGIILAAEGDRLAGVTVFRPEGTEGAVYTHYTGVDRVFRGRQIALALKLKSIEAAKAMGAPRMRTNNDAQNKPMLAVNRKLGYQPEPGFWRLIKQAE
jgi:GNAT superfamily N-acetyltransferase